MVISFYKKDNKIHELRGGFNPSIGVSDPLNKDEIREHLENSETPPTQTPFRMVDKEILLNEIKVFIESMESGSVDEVKVISMIQKLYTSQQELQMKEFYEKLKEFYDTEGIPYTTEDLENHTAKSFNISSYSYTNNVSSNPRSIT